MPARRRKVKSKVARWIYKKCKPKQHWKQVMGEVTEHAILLVSAFPKALSSLLHKYPQIGLSRSRSSVRDSSTGGLQKSSSPGKINERERKEREKAEAELDIFPNKNCPCPAPQGALGGERWQLFRLEARGWVSFAFCICQIVKAPAGEETSSPSMPGWDGSRWPRVTNCRQRPASALSWIQHCELNEDEEGGTW